MRSSVKNDPVLARFQAEAHALFGERMARAVLFGSRARGDHRADSDYDVAIFLHDMPDRTAAMDGLARMETEILLDTGAVINALPFPVEAWRDRTAFMGEVRRDGRDL